MSTLSGTKAIIIGGSMAGLVTARVLSDHFDLVTILERDRLPPDAEARRGVPQGRHAHVLLASGQQRLDTWFPGLTDELIGRGAVALDPTEIVWHQAGDFRIRSDLGFVSLSMSRPLLERTVRERLVQQCSNVTLSEDASVRELIVQNDAVAGVRLDEGELRADLVVDCSGRNTRFLDQLANAGFPAPVVSAVRIDMAYGTRVVRRGPHDLDGSLAVVVGDPSRSNRVGTMVPIEDDRWIITMCSFHGEVPPTEPADYECFARALPSAALADVLARAEGLSPVLTYRMPTSRRRHFERLKRATPGFVVLGDAICSLNPIYGQGMSSAALQAHALGRTIERHGATSPTLSRAFYRRAAKVVDVPWRLAAGADFADPRTTGSKPVGTDFTIRYLEKVYRACHTSVAVARQTMRVHNLLARPESLVTPAMVLRVLFASRRSPH